MDGTWTNQGLGSCEDADRIYPARRGARGILSGSTEWALQSARAEDARHGGAGATEERAG